MRSHSSQCECIVRIREDSRIDLHDFPRLERLGHVETSGKDCPRPRDLARLVRGALQAVRRAALQHREHVHKAYKLKVESLPPRIESNGQVARTGQWVGFIEHSEATRGCVRLLIEPKYESFHEIYEEVVKKTPSLSPALALAVADIHLGSSGSLPAVNTAIWLIEEYASRNPPYLVAEKPLSSITSITPRDILVERRLRLNERYYSTLAASASILAQALKQLNLPATPLLRAMAANYTKLQQWFLASLAANPRIIEAFHEYWLEEPDYNMLLEVKAAIRYTSPIPGSATGTTWLLLTPAPKIYEIYVLLKTIESLQQRYGRIPSPCSSDKIHCYYMKTPNRTRLKVYYNRPPRTFSRLVYSITRSRPHPDILLAYNGETRIVIDAKYRLSFALSPSRDSSRLELAEALRLLGYITDLARNKHLRAILAVPDKNKASDRITKFLDGLAVDIQVVEVNPKTNTTELVTALFNI